MATEKRGADPDLRSFLSEEFYRFDFFQAVSLIEALSFGNKPLGEAARPQDEPVRFKVRPGFAFPASDISALKLGEPGERAEMEVAFLGLIGPSGVLPHWYNEMALERQRIGDFAMVEFFNLFHHRILSLLYLAWKRGRITSCVGARGDDRYARYFGRLIGLSEAGAGESASIGNQSLLPLSGILARRVPTVAAIAAAVSYRCRQPARVEPFVERLLHFSLEERTVVGRANSVLGESTICGHEFCECSSKFRVVVGPMKGDEFGRFLPGGELLAAIFALVRFMVGIEFEFDLGVILKRDQVPGCRLGSPVGGFKPLLGWSSWLKAPGVVLSEDQRVIFAEPDAMAQA